MFRIRTFFCLLLCATIGHAQQAFVTANYFNGGKTQVVLNFVLSAGDYAFINALKSGQSWSYVNRAGACSNGAPTPDELNSDGYPVAGSKGITSCGGLLTLFSIPHSDELAGDYIVDWTGKCKIGVSASFSTISGSGSVSGSYGTSPWRIRFNANQSKIPFSLSASDGTCGNVKFYNINHQDILNNGAVFTPYFEQILKDAKIGSIRFEDWQGDYGQVTNITNWADNKPTSYVYYWGAEFRRSIYAGSTGTGGGCTEVIDGSGSAYCISYGNGAPVDKQEMILVWDQSGTGGSVSPEVTLNLNNTGPVRVVDMNGLAIIGGAGGQGLYTTEVPAAGKEGTVVYDAKLNVWLKYGGDAAIGNVGLINAIPPAIMIRLCNDIGAHCWINIPYLSLDPDQDYVTGLATLAKNTLIAGLQLIVEPPDETWNGLYPWTNYANAKAAANWPAATDKSYNQEYGKWVSVIGQDVSAVYGGDKSKYSIEDCVWMIQAANSAPRFTSPNYVTYDGGPPAYNYVTNLCLPGYWYPTEFLTMQETIDAYNYVTSGSTVTQAALARSFIDTATGVTGNTQFSIPSVNTLYANFASFLAGINSSYGTHIGMNQYEGGYNDVTTIAAHSGVASITSISSASSAVLTLGNGSYSDPMSAVVGMPVTVTGVTPSGFNGTYTVTAVGVGANINKVTINLNSTSLTYSSGGTMTYLGASAAISSISSNSRECVFVLSSPLTIWPGYSVTISGASPSGYNGRKQIVSTDSTGLNVTTTLDCTSLGAISGNPVMTANMLTVAQTLRIAAKFAPDIQTLTTTNYTDWANNGGTFPSTFVFSTNSWNGTSAHSVSAPSGWANFQSIYNTPSPQWNATVSWNGGTYP